MAATLSIEEEHGTYVGHVHPHNGYYAGDFSHRDVRTPMVLNAHHVASRPARRLVGPWRLSEA